MVPTVHLPRALCRWSRSTRFHSPQGATVSSGSARPSAADQAYLMLRQSQASIHHLVSRKRCESGVMQQLGFPRQSASHSAPGCRAGLVRAGAAERSIQKRHGAGGCGRPRGTATSFASQAIKLRAQLKGRETVTGVYIVQCGPRFDL